MLRVISTNNITTDMIRSNHKYVFNSQKYRFRFQFTEISLSSHLAAFLPSFVKNPKGGEIRSRR
jgi:hypothetical protein